MIIECTNCETRFRLDESSIKGSGVKVKCTKCQNVFVVAKPDGDGGEEPSIESHADSEPPIDQSPLETTDDITDPTTWGLLDNSPDDETEAETEAGPPIDDSPEEIPEETPNDNLTDLSAWGLEGETDPEEDKDISSDDPTDETPGDDLTDLSAWGLEGEAATEEAKDISSDDSTDETPGDDLTDLSAWGLEEDGEDTGSDPSIDEQSPGEIPDTSEPLMDNAPEETPGDDLTDLSAWGLEEDGEEEEDKPVVAEPDGELDWDLGAEDETAKNEEDSAEDEDWELEKAATPSPSEEEMPEEATTGGVLEDLDLGLGDDTGVQQGISESEAGEAGVQDVPQASGSKSKLLMVIAVIMVVFWGIGGAYYVFFLKDSGQIETQLSIENLKSIFVDNKKMGTKVLAIRGKIENHLEEAKEISGVKITILDSNDKPLASKTVSLSKILTKNNLKVRSKEEIDSLYRNHEKNSIPAKESMPVMAVFTELPKGLSQYEIEIIQ